MIRVGLFEPEIPPNTGNIARLCGAVGVSLHLIGTLGFRLDEKSLKRSGLDYWPHVEVHRHATLEEFESLIASGRIYYFSSHATTPYTSVTYQKGDGLLFGSESQGLPTWVMDRYSEKGLLIPMPGSAPIRSLNLATSVGIAVYECLRQFNAW
ncbi:MAG: tRNA (cytidine(34)-2'-O)-methyltransferase [Gemmataceae bacterium]